MAAEGGRDMARHEQECRRQRSPQVHVGIGELPGAGWLELSATAAERWRALLDAELGPSHLAALAAEAYVDRWTSHKDSKKVMRPRKGSRPGVPLADCDFNTLFAAVHRYLDGLLRGRGLLPAAESVQAPFANDEDTRSSQQEEDASVWACAPFSST